MTRRQWILVLGVFLLLQGIGVASDGDLPDPKRTPGAANPDVTQDNIHQTICVSGWTKTIRPPVKYTNPLKQKQIEEYGYPDKDPALYEEDHLISLQLGGHPTDAHNLWPEPYQIPCGARVKDVLETRLKRLVCKGDITLEEAQHLIATNWIEAYKKYVDPDGCPAAEQEQ